LGKVCGKIGENVEGGINAPNSWKVEGSSVRVGKIPLSSKETKVRVQVIVHFVNPVVGERSFLSKSKSSAISGDISSTRKTRSPIWNLGKGHRE